MKLLANFEKEIENNNIIDFSARYIWNPEDSIAFQESFAHPAIQKEINAFLEDTIDIGSQSTNKATERMYSIFENACNVSLKKKKKKKTVSRKHEVWLDDDHKEMKKGGWKKFTYVKIFERSYHSWLFL